MPLTRQHMICSTLKALRLLSGRAREKFEVYSPRERRSTEISLNKTLKITTVFVYTLLSASWSIAQDEESSHFNFGFSGFGGIGGIYHTSDEFSFEKDIGRFNATGANKLDFSNLSHLGLQSNIGMPLNLGAVFQVVLADQPDFNTNTAVRIAALSYQPNPHVLLRAGRLPPNVYLLSENRKISYSYLWTMPVQEVYGPEGLDHIDGIEFDYSHPLGPGYFNGTATAGTSSFNVIVPDYTRIIPDVDNGFENKIDDIFNLKLEYAVNSWTFRASYTRGDYISSRDDISVLRQALSDIAFLWREAQTLSDLLDFEGARTRYNNIGVIYDDGKWNIQTEYSMLDGKSAVIPDTKSSYISIGRNFGQLTPYMLLSTVRTKEVYSLQTTPPDFSFFTNTGNSETNELADLANQFNVLVSTSTQLLNERYDQDNFSMGVRYDFRTTQSLKFQWDHKWVKSGGDELWFRLPENDDKEGEVDIFSFTYEFVF